MIKPEELRIGNRVRVVGPHTVGDGYTTLSKHDLGGIYLYGGEYAIEPIPLAPEILEAAGFGATHAADNVHTSYYSDDMKLELDFDHRHHDWGYRPFMGDETFGIGIQYLHQLQNLYHALTGQELEVKFPAHAS